MQPKPPPDSVLFQARRHALRTGVALAAATTGWARHAAAQSVRTFPASARLGRLEMRHFPEAILNDAPVRFGAGARIYDERNMIVMPAGLSGVLDVLVERDPVGNIGRVWIVSADELKAAQARERASGESASQGR